jgi:hypothetical protein
MRGLEGSPGTPETSVSDNLHTLRLVLAAYQSMSSGQSVDPSTV